ncbi:amine dehydrogenase large subunit [Paracoccus homiensis]|uniref:Methylamine dehydrogenase heavy chain n=1 Tax=Paracoccus homiensis TaxID=364199 RepID=A0A1I0H738_9RHOB|nr:amine dehydrogenase large subunit [Paracoccus homiensis]SET78587.1 methylamine dehydrogenase heavy chain [Paracoccus homiensis]
MKHLLLTSFSALVASGTFVAAQEVDIEPETLTVEERISEGEHVFVMDFGINGSSPIYVLNADDLSLEGSIGTGTFAQMMMTKDHSSLYSLSAYLRRYTYGEVEAVVHEWDPVTLKARREFMVSNKYAQSLSQKGMVNITADGKFLVIQNATPATSVNIVDLAEGADLVEIPTPGCWTAYPSVEGSSFTTLCGDGTIAKYSWADDGSFDQPAKSEKIFDAEDDPLWGDAMRVGDKLVYVSYGGSLYVVDDNGEAPELSAKIDFAEEGWAPSGYNLMGYNAPTNTLFVLMHSNPSDGSHKFPAEEIWAIDMESQKVVGRSEAHGESSIAVSSGETPEVIAIDHLGGVHRYEVEMGDSVTLTEAVAAEGVAFFPTIVATDY